MSNATAIEKIQEHLEVIKSGNGKVAPGQPLEFSPACSENDAIWQGDLQIVISAKPETGMVKLEKKDVTVQLVPGNTQGAKHCLDTRDVEMWVPKDWNEESLMGPWVKASKDVTIIHPTHGAVKVPAGMAFQCYYQKEWNKEEAKERRARD
jgi:hypothetical protein